MQRKVRGRARANDAAVSDLSVCLAVKPWQNQLAHFAQDGRVRPRRIGNKMQQPLVLRRDQTRIRQSLLNLASNANKFTEKGTITIAADQEQENGHDWVTLAVTDTGIGMTAEQ